jgi:hypothetical protein
MNKTAVIITPCPSHPTTAGNRSRVFEVGRRLREYGFRIIFVHYNLEQVNESAHESMKGYWDEYHSIIVPQDRRRIELIEPESFASHELRAFVARVCKSANPSLVVVNYVWMAGVLDAIPPGIVKVIDIHDRFGCRHELLRLAGAEPSWVTLSPHREAASASKADAVWCLSRQETDYFRQMIARPVLYMPHLVKSSFIKRMSDDEKPRFLFFGSSNPVNQQSLNCLERIAKPLSQSAEFLICGGVSTLLSRSASSNIRTIGYVQDLAEYFEDGWISVNPVFLATGTKIKTIDTLRFGAPIVSGCAGFDGVDTDEPLHVLPDEAAFQAAIESIIAGAVSVDELAAASRRVFSAFEKTGRTAFEEFLDAYVLTGRRDAIRVEPSAEVERISAVAGASAQFPDAATSPVTWKKADFVRLAGASFRAGRLEFGMAAVTACLALDPVSASLNLFRAYAALSLGRNAEAADALATHDWLVRRGAADYASGLKLAGGAAIVASGDASVLVGMMQRIGEAIAPNVMHGTEPLDSRAAAALLRLVSHLGGRDHSPAISASPVLLPKIRGSRADQVADGGSLEAQLYIPEGMIGERPQILILETKKPGCIAGCSANDGESSLELAMRSPTRFVLPVQVLAAPSEGVAKFVELSIRGRVEDGDYNRFWEDIDVRISEETPVYPLGISRHIEGGASACLLRDIGLGEGLKGSGWHNADLLADGNFGRWTRRSFTLMLPAISYPNARLFLELIVTGKDGLKSDPIHSVRIDGRSLQHETVEDAVTRRSHVLIELNEKTLANRTWEVEITASAEEKIAGENDRRLISLYVTGARMWALLPSMAGAIDVLSWSRGRVAKLLNAGEPAEFDLAGFRPRAGALVLALESGSTADEEGAETDGDEFALEWDDRLLPPAFVDRSTLVFPVDAHADPHTGARIRLLPPSLKRRGRDFWMIQSFKIEPGITAPASRTYGPGQDRFWEGFHPPEPFAAGYGRWMSGCGTLHFVAHETSVLTLYVFRERDLYVRGHLTAQLDGLEIPVRREAWNLGEAMFMFEIPGGSGERRLTISTADCFVPGDGDVRELSMLVHRFVVEPGHLPEKQIEAPRFEMQVAREPQPPARRAPAGRRKAARAARAATDAS